MIRSKELCIRASERLLAVGDRLDLETLEAEVQLNQLADVRFVFDDQNS